MFVARNRVRRPLRSKVSKNHNPMMSRSPLLFSILSVMVLIPAGMAQAATVGVNFQHGVYGDNTGIQPQETAMSISGADWTNFSIDGDNSKGGGFTSTGGLNVAWNGSLQYQAGSEAVDGNNAGQQIFRVYLDDGDAGNSYSPTDGYGVSVQVSGLAAFMGANNASSYSLTLYFSTDSTALRPAQIRQGLLPAVATDTAISSLASLGTISAILPLGDGTYPTGPITGGTDTGGSRGIGTLGGLTADAITIALPSTGDGRGSLAGFSLTAVPEPSSALMLGGLGLAGLLRRRRA